MDVFPNHHHMSLSTLVILLAVFRAFSLLLEDVHVKKIVTFLTRVDLLNRVLVVARRYDHSQDRAKPLSCEQLVPFRATALIINSLVLFHVLVLRRGNVAWTSFTFEKQKRTIPKAYLPYLRATIQDDIKSSTPTNS